MSSSPTSKSAAPTQDKHNIFSFKDKNKILHLGWIAFFLTFFVWFNHAPFLSAIGETLNLSKDQIKTLLILNVALTIPARVIIGMLTDRFGGRIVFFCLMVVTAVPLYLVSLADEFIEFLLASLGFGLAGGGFAVGIAYVASWFEKENQGTALGIFGAGNAGAAITTLVAPTALLWLTDTGGDPEGWRALPRIYAGILVATAVLFVVLGRERAMAPPRHQSFRERIAPLFSLRVWRFGLYYFFVF